MRYANRKLERRRADRSGSARRGPRATMLSLAAAAVFIALTKSQNPDMNVKPMLFTLVAVTVACVIMNFLSRRSGGDG